jgi:hypothetical protein
MPPGTVWSLTGCNLERAIAVVKQKTQAFAAFLGVCGIPRKVVGACCIPTTFYPVSTGAYARQQAKNTRRDAVANQFSPTPAMAATEDREPKKRPRLVRAAALSLAGHASGFSSAALVVVLAFA